MNHTEKKNRQKSDALPRELQLLAPDHRSIFDCSSQVAGDGLGADSIWRKQGFLQGGVAQGVALLPEHTSFGAGICHIQGDTSRGITLL